MIAPAPGPPPENLDLRDFDALIFDLGGVILPLEYQRTIDELSLLFGGDAAKLYTQMKQHDLFDRFERGEVTSETFRGELSSLLQESTVDSRITAESLDNAWNALLGVIPEDHLLWLKTVGKEKRVFLLSNTNEIHVARFLEDYRKNHESQHGPWAELFERAYYSHDMGARKPEPRIYKQLIETHGLRPERTLFLDDNPDNVRGARELGLKAHHHPSNFPLPARFSLD